MNIVLVTGTLLAVVAVAVFQPGSEDKKNRLRTDKRQEEADKNESSEETPSKEKEVKVKEKVKKVNETWKEEVYTLQMCEERAMDATEELNTFLESETGAMVSTMLRKFLFILPMKVAAKTVKMVGSMMAEIEINSINLIGQKMVRKANFCLEQARKKKETESMLKAQRKNNNKGNGMKEEKKGGGQADKETTHNDNTVPSLKSSRGENHDGEWKQMKQTDEHSQNLPSQKQGESQVADEIDQLKHETVLTQGEELLKQGFEDQPDKQPSSPSDLHQSKEPPADHVQAILESSGSKEGDKQPPNLKVPENHVMLGEQLNVLQHPGHEEALPRSTRDGHLKEDEKSKDGEVVKEEQGLEENGDKILENIDVKDDAKFENVNSSSVSRKEDQDVYLKVKEEETEKGKGMENKNQESKIQNEINENEEDKKTNVKGDSQPGQKELNHQKGDLQMKVDHNDLDKPKEHSDNEVKEVNTVKRDKERVTQLEQEQKFKGEAEDKAPNESMPNVDPEVGLRDNHEVKQQPKKTLINDDQVNEPKVNPEEKDSSQDTEQGLEKDKGKKSQQGKIGETVLHQPPSTNHDQNEDFVPNEAHY